MSQQDSIELIRDLVNTPGVTGNEGPVRRRIRELLPEGPRVAEDELGNLLATMGEGPQVVVIAHMDELGVAISNINDGGGLHIHPVGGIDPRTVMGQMWDIHTADGVVTGVTALKPPHLMEDRAEMKKIPPWSQMRMDIGARSREEVEAMGVRILDAATLRKHFGVMNGRYIAARAIDDRFGCAALLEVLRKMAPAGGVDGLELTFAWSVQEEIGVRGAYAIAHKLRPKYVIALDTCSTTDGPGMGDRFAPFMLGEGPGLRLLDSRAWATPYMRDLVEDVAREHSIPVQKAITGGYTDGAAIQESGCLMIPLGLPVRYTHTAVEVIHMGDYAHLVQLLPLVLEEIGRREREQVDK